VVTLIRQFLADVNLQTGRAENRFNLLQLERQLLFRPGEDVVRSFGELFSPPHCDLYAQLGSAVEGRGA
jgi:hypothetical protein